MPATVDISTIRRLPWVDFSTILDNTNADRRQQVILDLLQNNMADSADDIYYIYHDAKTNTYSTEVDENSEEVQNFIGSILLKMYKKAKKQIKPNEIIKKATINMNKTKT